MITDIDYNCRISLLNHDCFELIDNGESGSRKKENQKRRDVLHIIFDARIKSELVAVFFIADETRRGWIRTSKDRKSTRLNSSHLGISYAVFCLKKKKKKKKI